jgi:hypothetical protein
MAKYNGHKNWNHWNVSLWINNDEGLYNLARNHVKYGRTKVNAAKRLLNELLESGYSKTPDGAPYSLSSVRAALIGM